MTIFPITILKKYPFYTLLLVNLALRPFLCGTGSFYRKNSVWFIPSTVRTQVIDTNNDF